MADEIQTKLLKGPEGGTPAQQQYLTLTLSLFVFVDGIWSSSDFLYSGAAEQAFHLAHHLLAPQKKGGGTALNIQKGPSSQL